ncbi:MAG TPA: hypothetical protein VMV40_02610 [Acidiferrobacter sp.]|nr:hypothetical protein [Acidiferrobacter sp.]
MPNPAYEGRLSAGLVADIRDRVTGRYGRANARLGFLNPPGGSGRIVWIKTDAGIATNTLAGEIACAIATRRQDVRLIVTFEAEYPTVLAALKTCPRTGYGFGPADRAAASARVLARLAPAGVVALGSALRPRLARALACAQIPCCVVHGLPPDGAGPCYGFPNTFDERAAWRDHPHTDVAFSSLMASAQVEPVFAGIAGAHARALWWFADPEAEQAEALVAMWRRSRLARTDILFLGAGTAAATRLSVWDQDRKPLPVGAVVWVDDERFWPALAASCTGVHLVHPPERLLWAALAGGRVVSARRTADLGLLRPAPIPEWGDADIWRYWEDLVENPAIGRAVGDDVRRFFWGERRDAAAATEALLARVGGW